jgi:hypothetical protein
MKGDRMKRFVSSVVAMVCISVILAAVGGVAGASSPPLSVKQAAKALTAARIKVNLAMTKSMTLIGRDATTGTLTVQQIGPDVQPWLEAAKVYRNRLTSIAWPAKYQSDAENLIAQLAVLSGQLASAPTQDAATIASWRAQMNSDSGAYNTALHKLQKALGLRRTTDFSSLPNTTTTTTPPTATTTPPTTTTATAPAPPTSNPPAPLPTVGPCASAPNTDVDFEPDTLGFNCISGGDPDALTDITWTAWTSSQAFGNGTLTVGGQSYPDSDVTLSDPEQPAQGANAYIFQDATVETPGGLIITGSTPGEWGTAS